MPTPIRYTPGVILAKASRRAGEQGVALEEAGATDFDWDAIDKGHAPQEDRAPQQDGDPATILRLLHLFLRKNVIAREDGRVRTLQAIGARLMVLDYLLDQGVSSSLAANLARFNVSRAWASKIAREFHEITGLRPIRTNGERRSNPRQINPVPQKRGARCL